MALTGGTSGTVPSHPTPGLALPGCGSCGVGGQWSQPWPAGLTQFTAWLTKARQQKRKARLLRGRGASDSGRGLKTAARHSGSYLSSHSSGGTARRIMGVRGVGYIMNSRRAWATRQEAVSKNPKGKERVGVGRGETAQWAKASLMSIPRSSVMGRKNQVLQAGLWPPQTQNKNDLELFFKM